MRKVRPRTVREFFGLAAQHMNMDYSAWEGYEIDGTRTELDGSR